MTACEVNFDGLVGPTHNYSGLSYGNVASQSNVSAPSNPKQAAKQGLRKMRTLHQLGVTQGILAPQERPALDALRRLGFSGPDHAVLAEAGRSAPRLLAACCSASSMWAANAATVSPSADTADAKVHFTPANLQSNLHRSIESETTAKVLKAMFPDPARFAHHRPLPAVPSFGDEGAANHTRLCVEYGAPGVELFVHGQEAFGAGPRPTRYPARHTLESSQAISRLHRLDPERVVFAQQRPAVIDKGVFHNDVIAVGNQHLLFFHQDAFLDGDEVKRQIREKFGAAPFHFIEVAEAEVSVEDAVRSYLFNSQIVTRPGGDMALILPAECRNTPPVWDYLQALIANDNPITQLEILDLNQSMRNGGGPACLRLRVVLSEQELASVNPAVMFSERLFDTLDNWIDKYYRDRLTEKDLMDPALLDESRAALDELTQILALGMVYSCQAA